MQHAAPILLAMSIFSFATNADTNTVTDVFQAPIRKVAELLDGSGIDVRIRDYR